MKAVVHERYGTPEVLSVQDVEVPEVGDDRVLVRVRAASLNARDWHMVTGTPYFMRLFVGLRRPKVPVAGADFAGVVEEVGANATGFAVGDEVFGSGPGSCAEYVSVHRERLAHMPAGSTFEQAAALPIAAVTALQAVRERGGVQAGARVLVNGAAGGVGTFSVQIAKALGAEVTAVCSTPNVEMVRSLGADHVVDYTADDFAASAERYDVMIDNVGNRALSDCKRVLVDGGVYVMVSGPKGKLLGPVPRMLCSVFSFMFGGRKRAVFVAEETTERLEYLAGLVESGDVSPVVERTYDVSETADALAYIGTGHVRGKLVITV